MKKQLFATVSFMLLTTFAFAQMNIQGLVKDKDGNALEGASVQVISTTRGTHTNSKGEFSIALNKGEKIRVSLVGFQSRDWEPVSGLAHEIILESALTELDQVVVVGTRRSNRVRTETPVPVDVVPISQTQFPTGKMDVTSLLNFSAPSFNHSKQSGSDGADHVDLGTLRGLGPDQTLVLVNGKRRHQSAFVSVFGTRGRGNSGTDLNAIPQTSIDRIEILRDGASAQYGSDAIAGVMNIILKKETGKLTGNVGYAAYYDDEYNTILSKDQGYNEYDSKLDGKTFSAGANYGLNLGSQGGFLNLTADYVTTSKTYRQDPSQTLPFNIYRRTHGDGSYDGIGAGLNAEYPLNDHGNCSLYAFANYTSRETDAFAFTRRFGDNPERFPTDASGNLIQVPGIIKSDGAGSYYYNPHIQTEISDLSGTLGLKGKLGENWNYDLSGTHGSNDFHFFGDQTFNAGLGADKTHFDDGGFKFSQSTANLNLSREIPSILKGMHLALGAEYRSENYELYAGEEASYANYNPDKPSGAQGFPGYQPGDEVDASRNTFGVYADVETDVCRSLLLGAAFRYENYSDFGSTSNYKFTGRYKIDATTALRASVSTGFRAPSLQQINFSSTFTTVQGGLISEVKIAPNSSPITRAAGIPELKQEESVNVSLGITLRPANNLIFSVDAYRVEVEDRVVLSGQFSADDASLSQNLRDILNNLKVSYAQFFANAVNTTNMGIDVVLEYSHSCGSGNLKYLFTGNAQKMEIDQINIPAELNTSESNREYFFSEREQYFLIASAPKTKFGMALDYSWDRFSVGTRLNYFGQVNLLGYGDFNTLEPQVPTDADENIRVRDEYNYRRRWVHDVFASVKIMEGAKIYLGVDNLWNVHPDLGFAPGAAGWAYNNETGGPWDAVQMGGNGRRLFARLAFQF
ncbi:MAG: TonB-dependent receptor [Saprospiraceae bacterium]|nr:TonB-dependent receptor [Saprospiraceae bacterium]